MSNDKTIDPELLSIDQPSEAGKPYYLYTGGVLKLVEMTANEFDTKHHPFSTWQGYINSLPSIQVSEDLKKIWKEGQRVEVGKEFMFAWYEKNLMWKSITPVPDNNTLRVVTLKEASFYINPALIGAGEPLKPDRTFTLQDMLDIHREGAHNANTFCGYPSELNKYLNNCVSDYMRYKFEIDIPKQQ